MKNRQSTAAAHHIPALLVLFCLLIPCMTSTAHAADYSDIQGHWAQDVIEKWSDSGILSGYSDGTFRPNNNVTRAQLSSVLYRIWGCEPVKDGFDYPDLPKDLWCYDAVNTMHMYGVTLNTDARMLPDGLLTREEAFYMIGKAFVVDGFRDSNNAFTRAPDKDLVNPYYANIIEQMMYDGYVHGSADGYIHPQRSITRAEVMKVIDNMIDVLIDKPGSYTVPYGQNTLVLCKEVTLQLEEYHSGGAKPNRTYLMCDASKGGVSFVSLPTNTKNPQTTLISISEESAVYQCDDLCRVDNNTQKRMITLSQQKLPDTRFSGGRGTVDFPYMISTPEQFRLLVECNKASKKFSVFRLAQDLNLGTLSRPLDSLTQDFTTFSLDGAGHTLTYQMVNHASTDNFCGLFQTLHGSCSNLTLKGSVDITYSGSTLQETAFSFGGIAGYLAGDVTNCSADMDINLTGNCTQLEAGGLIGTSSSIKIDKCSAKGTLFAKGSSSTMDSILIGGIIGSGYVGEVLAPGSTITNCSAAGSVSAQGSVHSSVGGIAGTITDLLSNTGEDPLYLNRNGLENCWSTATVNGAGASFQCDAGGLVGQLNLGTMKNCWAKSTVTVDGGHYQNVGGIAGACYSGCSISDCWSNAAGLASGGDLHAGGIVGRLVGTVSNCYTLGASQFEKDNAITFQEWNDGTVTACTDFTGSTSTQRSQFYQTCGWDFASIWDMTGTYPILRNCEPEKQVSCQ